MFPQFEFLEKDPRKRRSHCDNFDMVIYYLDGLQVRFGFVNSRGYVKWGPGLNLCSSS